jgi:hypothetical protein
VGDARANDLTLIVIRGKLVNCLIDTGAFCSLLPERTALSIGCHVEPNVTCLKGIGNKVVATATYGKTTVLVECETASFELDFFLVRDVDLEYEAIIGKNVTQYPDILIITDTSGTRLERLRSQIQTVGVNVMAADWLMSAVANLNGAFRKMLICLLEEFSEMFTEGNRVRCITTAEMTIRLKDDSVITYHPYRLSVAEKEKLRAIIKDLISNKIIRESDSPFASPVLLVKKKDGSDRLCVDFRALMVSDVCVKNSRPCAY